MKKIVVIIFMFISCLSPIFASENIEAVNVYNAGIDYFEKDNVEMAIQSFRKAISLDPTFQEAYYNLAQILAAENKIEEAITLYKTSINIDSTDFQSVFALAEIYYQKKQYQNALTYLNKVPYEDENYPNSLKLRKAIDERLKEIAIANEAKAKEAQQEKQRMMSFLPTFVFKDIKNPSGIATDGLGNTYIASFSQNTVYKYNKNNERSIFVSPSILNGPLGLCTDKNNNLYIANYNAGNILKVLPQGAPYIFAKVKKPYIVTVFDDFLYVSEQETNTVIKYSLK